MTSLAEQGHVAVRPPDESVDLIVIGAGPAGLAAAGEAARHGLSVLLLDEQESVGGQIYRHVTDPDTSRHEILGIDYQRGLSVAADFKASGAGYWPRTAVWQVTREHRVHALRDGHIATLEARHIVVATGAMERPFPIPGWTLPGVMTAGAAQILMKSSGIVPQEPPVLVGCGPLLYLLAWQYLRAGVRIKAILDTTSRDDQRQALAHVGGALAGWRDLLKGMSLLSAIKRHGVPHYKGVSALSIHGNERVEEVHFQKDGREQTLSTQLVLLHQGVIPNTQITWSLRAEHAWDESQLCWRPTVDSWGALDVPGVYVAGDGTGIGGARAAEIQGRLTGLAVACAAGKLDESSRDHQAAPLRRALKGFRRIRPFLDSLYRPKDANRIPRDDVIVCRCEEVTAGRLREYVQLGCTGPNQTKSFSRCGMGPCQGRQCGLTVTELIAGTRGVPPSGVGYYRIRPPIKPITLAQLAQEALENDR
jgi:NADPH-dependent 2,4-dienoyl-CoA reductase/sulfur reductase-like enzyme